MATPLQTLAQQQVDTGSRFGLQARQELTWPEVTQICQAYLEAEKAIEDYRALLEEQEKQLTKVMAQRDSANGKLSALQRKYDALTTK